MLGLCRLHKMLLAALCAVMGRVESEKADVCRDVSEVVIKDRRIVQVRPDHNRTQCGRTGDCACQVRGAPATSPIAKSVPRNCVAD